MAAPKKGTKGYEQFQTRLRQAMINKYGSYEGYCQFMRENGRKGGKKSTGGGFAANRELAREAGRKGGLMSSRKGIRNGQGKAYAGI